MENTANNIKDTEIKKAKQLLEEGGYFTSNLWHIEDVRSRYECTDEEAQEVLDDVFSAESVYNTIYFNIDCFSEQRGLKLKE